MQEKKMDKRSVRSRKAIEAALINLLKTKEYDSITVTQLIKEAGYSRTAFYNNYLDVDDCLDSILEEQADFIFNSFQEAANQAFLKIGQKDITPGNPNELIFRIPYEIVYTNKEIYLMLNSRIPKVWTNMFIDKVMSRIRLNTTLLATGMEASTINVDLWIWSHFWDTLGRIIFWIEHGMIYSPEYMGRQQYLKRFDGAYVFPKGNHSVP